MELVQLLRRSATDPLLFATDLLGATPEPWQRQALEAIGSHDRVSIRSGHGVGKTTYFAWVALWFLLTRHPARVPIAANSQDQLRDTIWPEIRVWHKRLPEPLRDRLSVSAERVSVNGLDSFAVARTVSRDRPEGLQGFHADHLLFLVDEASGIPDIAFEIAQGTLSTPGAKAALAGNPTRGHGYFYDTHHGLRDRWVTLKVSSEDVPRARGHIADIAERYGRGSNQYRVRVLGEFPRQDDDTLIGLDLVEDAVDRDVEPIGRAAVWGVDVARFGDDRTAIAKRRGNCLLEPVQWWQGADTMQTVSRIVRQWEVTEKEERPAAINVDAVGLGAGVVDRLRQLGLPARAVNVGEAPHDRSGRYLRRNDELWFAARDWFLARDCRIPRDEQLIAELTGRKYGLSPTGKTAIESKDAMKRRGLRSPDIADAFILTFAGGDHATQMRRFARAEIDYDPLALDFPSGRGRDGGSAGTDYQPF